MARRQDSKIARWQDSFDRLLAVKVGTQPLVTYNYRANNGSLQSVVYGNGSIESYEYNVNDEVSDKVQFEQGVFIVCSEIQKKGTLIE